MKRKHSKKAFSWHSLKDEMLQLLFRPRRYHFTSCSCVFVVNLIFFSVSIFKGQTIAKLKPSALPSLQRSLVTNVFLAHCWGKDGSGRDNHARVSRMNDKLKARGVITWFDADRMVGNSQPQMAVVVCSSSSLVVCSSSSRRPIMIRCEI
jgi:transposase